MYSSDFKFLNLPISLPNRFSQFQEFIIYMRPNRYKLIKVEEIDLQELIWNVLKKISVKNLRTYK